MLVNIGFDIDGVLRDLFPYATNKYIETHPWDKFCFKEFEDIDSYDTSNWFIDGLRETDKKRIEFDFRNYIFDNGACLDIYTNAPIYEDAIDFNQKIETFKKELNNISISLITHQRGSEQKEGTILWLKKHNITEYDSLIFSGKKDEHGLHYMLEDNVDNCKAVEESGGCAVLRLQPYNLKEATQFGHCVSYTIQDYLNIIYKIEKG